MRKKQQNTRINAKYKKRKICYSKLHEVSRLKFSENLDTTRTVNNFFFFFLRLGGRGEGIQPSWEGEVCPKVFY